MLLIVSRGPTRRVQELIASGAVSNELLRAADHEADLLAHPYTGVEHLELARLRLTGRPAERDALGRELGVGMPTRWWRPRGRRSALRRTGREQTETARLAAERQSAETLTRNERPTGHARASRVDAITSWPALAPSVRWLAHPSKMITVLPPASTGASALVTGLARGWVPRAWPRRSDLRGRA